MNQYNPNIHHRRSIRLKDYNYSQTGMYFVTLCVREKECLFGNILDGVMHLNDAGRIVEKCWNDIPVHFPHVALGEFVIMPNHIHGIIVIENSATHPEWAKDFSRAKDFSPLRPGTSKTIGSIIRGFKIGVTKWMRQHTTSYEIWQRNYYEHIIRNEADYNRIAEYIVNNPQQWAEDTLHPNYRAEMCVVAG